MQIMLWGSTKMMQQEPRGTVLRRGFAASVSVKNRNYNKCMDTAGQFFDKWFPDVQGGRW